MYKFNRQYEMILEDIIQSVTPEELKERQAEYNKIQLKIIFDRLFKEGKMIKNPDGSYDVEGSINLFNCKIESLKDIPYVLKHIFGFFDCSYNKLTSLEGCPKVVHEYFTCSGNELTSLKGCPEIVERTFYCHNNSKKFTKEDIIKVCKVGGRIIA